MSDLSNIKTTTLDRLSAEVGGKLYAVTSFKLRMQLNTPASCELVLAQGESVRANRALKGFKKYDGSSSKPPQGNPFTPVSIYLHMNGQRDGVVLFRGFLSSVSRIAAKNVSGSYSGMVLNSIAPPRLMTAFSLNGYRYWGSTADGKGKGTAELHSAAAEEVGKVVGGNGYMWLFPKNEWSLHAADDFSLYIPEVTGILTNYVSEKRYSKESVTQHFETRGRKLLPNSQLADINSKTDNVLVNKVRTAIMKSNPYTIVQQITNRLLFLNMAPLPCGKMDILPEFPWSKETVGLIKINDILTIRDSTALNPATENVDMVMVPVNFGLRFQGNYVQWPENEDLPNAGISRVQQVPAWLSPFLDAVEIDEPKDGAKGKNNKSKKQSKEDQDKMADEYQTVALALAKAFFAKVKNSGVTLELTVPWYRLEFLDALGYLMEIEQPTIDREEEKENLFGMLAGAALKIQSTPGGSKATMQLSFTHVRGEELQEEFAIEEHPLYDIEGGPAEDIKAFMAKRNREYTRAVQKTLEGGAHTGYLKEAAAEARNKK